MNALITAFTVCLIVFSLFEIAARISEPNKTEVPIFTDRGK